MSAFPRCPTCLNDINPEVDRKLKCNHSFCSPCIRRALSTEGDFTCPVCGSTEKIRIKKKKYSTDTTNPSPPNVVGGAIMKQKQSSSENGLKPNSGCSYMELTTNVENVNIGADINFIIQLCNSQGRQVPGENYFKVEAFIEYVNKPREAVKLNLLREGKYESSYSPKNVGLLKFDAFLDGKRLKYAPKSVIVRPRGQIGCEIKGPLIGPRDFVEVSGSFLVTDGIGKALYLVDCLGREMGSISPPEDVPNERFSPMGIAKFKNRIYVTDMTNSCVHVYSNPQDPSSKYLYTSQISFGKNYLKKPLGIAAHPLSGEIYVADHEENQIFIFNQNHELIKCICTDNESEINQINCPELIVLNNGGNLLFVTDQGNSHIKVFELGGSGPCKLKKSIPTKFHSQAVKPVGITVDKNDTIYVTALHNKGGVVLTYAPEGTFLGSFGSWELSKPSGIQVLKTQESSPIVFVADSPGHRKNGSLKGFKI